MPLSGKALREKFSVLSLSPLKRDSQAMDVALTLLDDSHGVASDYNMSKK